MTGIDISPLALALARKNAAHNAELLPEGIVGNARFEEGDVLDVGGSRAGEAVMAEKYDVVTANPPYISREGFWRDTERSVRNFEPRLALVPEVVDEFAVAEASGWAGLEEDDFPEDYFYAKIVERAERVGAGVVMMEVAGCSQAQRVVEMVGRRKEWGRVEVWRDFLGAEEGVEDVTGDGILWRGVGDGRSVVCWRRKRS